MSLHRVAMWSPNYSSRGGAGVTHIVLHTAEGALTYQSLGNFFASESAGVSSHTGIDDTAGTIGEYVGREAKAWTASNANPWSVQAELCAFASWDRAEWDRHPTMLENAAAWIAEEAAAFGLPLDDIAAQAQNSSARGICQHNDLGSMGGGHWDCGPDFPIGRVIEMAGGVPGAAPAPPQPGGAAPPFPGVLLINFTTDPSAQVWQAQMSARGWRIGVDGMYGGESEGVCRSFQAEKGLAVDGVVGPDTWAASWTAPIT